MNRRTVLKNAGLLGLSYPLLSQGLASTKKVKAKKKLVVIATELGYYDPFFKPKTDDLASSQLLNLLKDYHNEMTVFRNIGQPEIGHGHKNGVGLLSCNMRQSNGAMMSVDQVAAEAVNQDARFKSLHLGGRGFVWNKNSRQVHSEMEIGPQKIYEKLFTKTAADEELKKKIDTLELFRKTTPANASSRYKAALKELEEEIRIDLAWNKKPIPEVEIDTALHLSDAHDRGYMSPIEQHLQLIRLGIQHDRAQIVVGGTPYIDKTSTIGIDGSYHSVGHKTSSKEAGYEEQLLKLEKHIFTGFDKFLKSMKENSLLDDTIVLIVGGFDDAGRHRRESIPTILIGGGFKHQGVVECKENDKLKIKQSHLYLSILHQMGIDAGDFSGDINNVDKIIL